MAKEYIGTKKVKEFNEIDGFVQYTLEDGSGDKVSKKQFDSMLAEEAYEDGMIRIKKWSPLVSAIVGLMLEEDMKVIEKNFVLNQVDATIVDNYDRASAKAYGRDYEHNISLKDLDRVLKS